MNIAVVRGVVLRDPTERTLATGQKAVSLDVSVSYEDRPNENLEVVWLDPPRNLVVPRQGNEVVAIGRVRRRFYKTGAGVVSRTEVVADTVLTSRQTSRITKALAEAAKSLVSR
jgi:single-strand DNA-binding protein